MDKRGTNLWALLEKDHDYDSYNCGWINGLILNYVIIQILSARLLHNGMPVTANGFELAPWLFWGDPISLILAAENVFWLDVLQTGAVY